MKRHQIQIFGTKLDLHVLLTAVECKRELQFVRAGQFDAAEAQSTYTIRNCDLGVAVTGDSNREISYLVADRTERIQARNVLQVRGGIKYAFDQRINPRTIVFRPGGEFNNQCVISGYVGTISEDSASITLFGLFSDEIKRQFKKIRSFYVGKGAREVLSGGGRLTTDVKSPELYDLKAD